MGFLDKLFSSSINKQMDSWLETATEEDLVALEKQGCDVSEYRAKIAARDQKISQAYNARFSSEPTASVIENPIQLEKLAPYNYTPRDMNSDFSKAVAGKPPIFGKDKYLQSIKDHPLIYTAIVQANQSLWGPGNNDNLPAVLVFAMDDAHRTNISWLKSTAKAIVDLKESADVPDDCRKLIASLRDDQSIFCWKVGASISGEADAWCVVHSFEKQSDLPRKALPTEGIVPFILKKAPEENIGVWFYDIPAEYYS